MLSFIGNVKMDSLEYLGKLLIYLKNFFLFYVMLLLRVYYRLLFYLFLV